MKLRHFSLRARLLGAFASAAFVTLAVSVSSYLGLDRTASEGAAIANSLKARGLFLSRSVDLARSAQVNFKKQVQEWKNILLRGSDPAAFTRHMESFANDEVATRESLDQLKALFATEGLSVGEIEESLESHKTLGLKYREALKLFDRTQPDSAAKVDRAVRGIDRAATDGIDRIVEYVKRFDAEATRELEAGFVRTISRTKGISAGGAALGVFVAFGLGLLLSRSLARELNHTVDRLRGGSNAVAATAVQVAATGSQLADGASQQAASLEETGASLEEMSSMTRRNADHAEAAKSLAASTRSAADVGFADMQEMSRAMGAIKTSSNNVGKIIKTIDEIAFQTNILALNAAVEAARAGQAGLGFAVVADEVRTLAQRSAHAARETAEKIDDAIAKSSHGVAISEKVGVALQEIVKNARSVDDLIRDIAVACKEQATGIEQVTTAVSQMDRVTQRNAAAAEESAGAAQELSGQAEELKGAVTSLLRLVAGQRKDEQQEIQSSAQQPRSRRKEVALEPVS